MISFNNWFNTFIEEKGLSDLEIEFENENGFNIMPIGVIQEFLAYSINEIQQEVKDKLVRMDFCNMNIIHFLEYIARGIGGIKHERP